MTAERPLSPPTAVLRTAGIVRIYRSATGETHALRGVDATFGAAVVHAVLGRSGSGKSSLLQVLALRERASAGELWLDGAAMSSVSGARLRALRRGRISWIAQRPAHGLFGHLDATEHLQLAADLRRGGRPGPGPDRPEPQAQLDRVGLAHRARSRPAQLSGGEQQRLAVAVGLAGTVGVGSVVVADEPTAELDDRSAQLVLGALRGAADAGACVIVATHDHRLVAGVDRVMLLRHGVLSSDREAGRSDTAVIDSAGRLQLPPEALALFPDARAVVRISGDHIRLEPPGTGR